MTVLAFEPWVSCRAVMLPVGSQLWLLKAALPTMEEECLLPNFS